jgi:CubicO group peptidase (beta-lactamase class C family)
LPLAFSQSGANEAVRPAAVALDRELNAIIERKDVPGLVVIAADRKGIVYQGAFGLAEVASGRAMSVDSIFRIASMTKAVTSVALMQLVEEGRVSLDDPAANYFPEFASPMVFESFDPVTHDYKLRPAKTTLTIRHLATHTSGLGYSFTSAIVRDFKPREGENYPVGPLLFEPGTQWIYGTGVDWIGRLVEKLSGKTLEAYFQEKIFGPLKMKDTSFNVPEDKQARLVNLSRRGAEGTFTEQPRQAPRVATRFNGGGGLYSTTGDYIRFLQMIINQGEFEGVRILSRETVAVMEKNQIGSVGVRALKSALPEQSADFTFVADGRDKWGIGFQITPDAAVGKRSANSLSWGGIDNTYYWADPTRGVSGVIMMQFLPFADSKALRAYDTFERGVYRLVAP